MNEQKQITPPFDSIETNRQDTQVDWKRVFYIFQKYFWIVILTSILGLMAGYAFFKKQTPLYKAQTSIVISNQLPSYLGSQLKNSISDITEDYWYEKRYLYTQYEIIKSRSIAIKVAKQLPKETVYKLLKTTKYIHREPTEKEYLKAAAVIKQLIRIAPVEESRIVNITFVSEYPEIAKEIVNLVAKTYIDENLEKRLSSTKSAGKWLNSQLQTLRTKLDEVEDKIYKFKVNHNILAMSLESKKESLTNIIKSRIQAVEMQEQNIRNLRAKLQQFRRLKNTDPIKDASADFLNNDNIRQLRLKYYKALTELKNLKIDFLEKNPDVLKQEFLTYSLKKQIKQELKFSEEALVAELKQKTKALSEAKTVLQNARKAAFALGNLEKDYNKLKREHNETSKLYELVLARLKETSLAEELKTNNIRRLDVATLPTRPFKPILSHNLALGLAVGLFFGFILLILFYYLDNTIKSREEMEYYLKTSFLGFVPILPEKERTSDYDTFIFHHPHSPVAEAVRSIRTNLLFKSPDKKMHSLLITSSAPLEGKTTLSSYLSISMAMGGEKTLLVDADMRRPRIHRIFDLKPKRGLSTLIVKKSTFEDSIYETQIPNLYILPCGPIPPNPAELEQSKHFDDVYEELLKRFDRVIFDSPPVGIVTDPAIIGQRVNGVIVVGRYASTTRHMLKNTFEKLDAVKINILGGVMNRVDVNRWGDNTYYYYRRKGKNRYGGYYSSSYTYYGSDVKDNESENKDKKNKKSDKSDKKNKKSEE